MCQWGVDNPAAWGSGEEEEEEEEEEAGLVGAAHDTILHITLIKHCLAYRVIIRTI